MKAKLSYDEAVSAYAQAIKALYGNDTRVLHPSEAVSSRSKTDNAWVLGNISDYLAIVYDDGKVWPIAYDTGQGSDWVSLKIGAELVGRSRPRVRQLIVEGKIKAKRSGRQWLVDSRDLQTYYAVARDDSKPATTTPREPEGDRTLEAELEAMACISGLDPEVRERVLAWATDIRAFYPPTVGHKHRVNRGGEIKIEVVLWSNKACSSDDPAEGWDAGYIQVPKQGKLGGHKSWMLINFRGQADPETVGKLLFESARRGGVKLVDLERRPPSASDGRPKVTFSD